ncbi:hypothetical protein M405DRAFT_417044 [Rhizopogon salebrosus TDB-379]|nr:hypothetical protein M405DRAFT_417044 [Rhizopogon salebrosus TDB-379]
MSCVRNEVAHGPNYSCRIQPSLSVHTSSLSNTIAASVEVVQIVEDTVKQNPNRPRSPIHKQSSRQSSPPMLNVQRYHHDASSRWSLSRCSLYFIVHSRFMGSGDRYTGVDIHQPSSPTHLPQNSSSDSAVTVSISGTAGPVVSSLSRVGD